MRRVARTRGFRVVSPKGIIARAASGLRGAVPLPREVAAVLKASATGVANSNY